MVFTFANLSSKRCLYIPFLDVEKYAVSYTKEAGG